MKITLSRAQARKLWMHAQGLDTATPFGAGPKATLKAIEQLGYVQIDTISVIERCHHHILFSRIPEYKRSHLTRCQTVDKTVFEYLTHALAYVSVKDYRFFLPAMNDKKKNPGTYYGNVKKEEMQKVLRLIKKEGAISIRDINDDVLVEKDHDWASRKPSKKALQFGFRCGDFVISERLGMLKKYDLAARHFDWDKKPKAASAGEVTDYRIDRALRSQAFVSVDSICYLEQKKVKLEVLKRLNKRVREGTLVHVEIEGLEKIPFWLEPGQLELSLDTSSELTHILSPFDPLLIQRKRSAAFFDYEHRFEAYIPKEKRVYGYFALPVIVGDQIVAALDLKTDREKRKLLVQKWTWIGKGKSSAHKRKIEEELQRFEKFQLDT